MSRIRIENNIAVNTNEVIKDPALVKKIVWYVSAKNTAFQPTRFDSQTTTALTGGSGAFISGVLLPDGRVFCVPYNAANGKIYDPATDTQFTTALTGGSGAFNGGVLLPDGRIFCVPENAANAKILDGSFSKNYNQYQLPKQIALSNILNKF